MVRQILRGSLDVAVDAQGLFPLVREGAAETSGVAKSWKKLRIKPANDWQILIAPRCHKHNPKRLGTKAYHQFALLQAQDAKTIGEFADAWRARFPDESKTNNNGRPGGELAWSVGHGFVRVIPPHAEGA